MSEPENIYVKQVKDTIDELINVATTFDIEALDRIYHDKLSVVMIDQDSNINIADKAAFKAIFQSKKDNGDAPLSTEASYNHIHADEDDAHVLITRKVNLTGEDQVLVLSIDLVRNDIGWQVIREVIYAKPDDAKDHPLH